MKQKYFLVSGLILALSLVVGGVAFAETDAVNPDLLVEESEDIPEPMLVEEVVPTLYEDNLEGEVVDDIIIGGLDSATDELDDVELDIPEEVPTGWGLFWRGVRERVSVAFTFDPVKKAEKQLVFAEERMAIAEKIAENTDNENAQERAEKMVERAQEFMAKVGENKDKWLEEGGERAEKLFKNVATHQVRVQKSFDRIELNLPEDKLEKWDELREKAEEKGQNFVNALQKGNVPEQVREHLENVKQRVENHLETVKQYRDEKKELLEAVKSGDENAKEGLEVLHEERKQELEQNREQYKEKMEVRKEVKDDLRESAMEGDEQAKKQLKVMNNAENIAQERVEKRLENTAEKLEDRADKLQEAAENGNEMAEKRLEKVEGEQERVENRLENMEEKPLLKPLQQKPLEQGEADDEGSDNGEDE